MIFIPISDKAEKDDKRALGAGFQSELNVEELRRLLATLPESIPGKFVLPPGLFSSQSHTSSVF